MRILILSGLAEGPAQTRYLAAAFARAGHTATTDIATADVVIAHSGACLTVPGPLANKLVVLANPSCGRRRQVLGMLSRKIRLDIALAVQERRISKWLYKTFWNSLYICNMRKNIRMAQGMKRHGFGIPAMQARKVAVITNWQDPWRATIRPSSLTPHPTYTFLNLPGGHDDLWYHPDLYVNIVQYLYDA
jgi:hypothetical protein